MYSQVTIPLCRNEGFTKNGYPEVIYKVFFVSLFDCLAPAQLSASAASYAACRGGF
jgi:hypothetical protein